MAVTHRLNYDEQLEELRSAVLRMGAHAVEMVRLACEAVDTGNVELAAKVVKMDDFVDLLEDECVLKTMSIVMREAPVATDLKRLLATIGIVGEIEKVGDDAVKLARRTAKLAGVISAEMRSMLSEMSERARQSFSSALRLYADYSDDLAGEIIASDDVIDAQYQEVRNRVKVLIRENPASTSAFLRTIDAFHTLEHVADHAVEIASRLKLHFGAPPSAEPT